jgi:XTP/dITP diphosphohydrolase
VPSQLVTIRRFRDLPAAHVALSKLESAGITCELADDEMVRMDWFYSNMIGGVRLQVAEDEIEDAEQVLAELPPALLGPEGVGSQYAQPICPHCGSIDVFHENRPTAVSLFALTYLSAPINSGVDRMKCNDCGHMWQPTSDRIAEDGQTDTTLYVATSNRGKLREFRKAAEMINVIIEPLPPREDTAPPAETGNTFEENARIKAEAYSRTLPAHLVFADDSGLEVTALNGGPGVYSARYAAADDSPDPSDEDNNYKLIYELSRRPDTERTARFVCVIAIAKDGETLGTFRGSVEGEILQAPLGKGGFGYDPLFLIPSLNKTMAELNEEEKFAISHRGNAFRALLRWLEEKGLVSPSSL